MTLRNSWILSVCFLKGISQRNLMNTSETLSSLGSHECKTCRQRSLSRDGLKKVIETILLIYRVCIPYGLHKGGSM